MALCSIAIAAGIVGVVAVVKGLVMRRRYGHLAFAGGPCGGAGMGGFGGAGPWAGHRGFGRWGGRRGGIGGSFWLRAIFARLDTTPGQEREIRAALEEMRDRAQSAKASLPDTRNNIGKAVAGETFDEAALEAVNARADATTEMVKDAFGAALKRIHGVLDTKQRERLAELITKGAFGRWGKGENEGPYRSSGV